MAEVKTSDVVLRRATSEDAGMVAEVYLQSFKGTYHFPLAHTDEQVRDHIRDDVIPTQETWVGVAATGPVVGMMVLEDAELDQLYVAPGWTRAGPSGRRRHLLGFFGEGRARARLCASRPGGRTAQHDLFSGHRRWRVVMMADL